MKKEDIIAVALTEFSKNSYDNVSVNTIIKDSQTSKGTFYHYFKTKEELYISLAERVLEDKIGYFNQLENKSHNNKKQESLAEPNPVYQANSNSEFSQIPLNIFDLLRQQVDKSIDFSLKYPKYTAFSIQVRNEPNEALKEKILQIMGAASSDYYATIIKESREKGFIRRDLPLEFTVCILSYMLTRFLEFMQSMNCELSIENKEYIKEQYGYYIDFMERGLSAD